MVAVRVHNGGAMPPEKIGKVFAAFIGGGDRHREKSRGLGLGLFITRDTTDPVSRKRR